MNKEWRDFLAGQGAHMDDGQVQHFGDVSAELAAAAHGTILADLSHLSFIRVGGPDAVEFLQGQLTCDVKPLDAVHSRLGAYCTPQGRMLAVMRILRREDDILLQLPAPLQDAILKRLKMYVLRSKVTLESMNQQLQAIGLSGPDAGNLLREHGNVPPAPEDNACVTREGVTIVRVPGISPRFEIIAAPAALMPLWRQLRGSAPPAGAPVWLWLDIMAGIPNILPPTSEAFVPQMTNLELLGGVSFDKGCYTGQEIVARMHYLGRLKQRMYRARVMSPTRPNPGDAIYVQGKGEQAIGTVIDAQLSPDGGYDLLMVARIENVEQDRLCLGAASGPPISIQPLPYALSAGV